MAPGDDAERWWAVLRGLDAAPIGTFHEFCARLLRRHAMEAGVDPEFAILDESIAGSLREEAVRIALCKLLAARDADLIVLASRLRPPPGPRGARPPGGGPRRRQPGGVGATGAGGDRRALARGARGPPLADGPRPCAATGRALSPPARGARLGRDQNP